MIELLVVLAIVGILMILFFFGTKGQIEKGRDAKRKDDLDKIKVAYENYYSDNDCYPPEDALSNRASTELDPYMSVVPRDPFTDEAYRYISLPNVCPGYKILTKLEYESDPSILEVGCFATACGASADYLDVNYGVSVGTQVPEEGFDNEAEGEGSSPTGQYVINSDELCVAIEATGYPDNLNCGGVTIHPSMAACLVERATGSYNKCTQ